MSIFGKDHTEEITELRREVARLRSELADARQIAVLRRPRNPVDGWATLYSPYRSSFDRYDIKTIVNLLLDHLGLEVRSTPPVESEIMLAKKEQTGA